AGPGCGARWGALVVGWVLTSRPQPFGFAKSRWSCAAVALVLREDHGVPVGREMVRLALRGAGLVWRRPRPVVRRRDPDRLIKLWALRRLLGELPDRPTPGVMAQLADHANHHIRTRGLRQRPPPTVHSPG